MLVLVSVVLLFSIFMLIVYVCKYRVNTLVTTKLSHIRLITLEGYRTKYKYRISA